MVLPSSDKTSKTHPANLPRTCGRCHEDLNITKKYEILIDHPIEIYESSVHGKATKGGIYVAGLAHSPRFLEETVAQAQGAAMRAAAYLWSGVVGEQATSVWVKERLCSYCGLCVEACPYGARVLDEEQRVAVVDYGLCQGCGVCAVVCPNKATLQKAFEHKQLMSAIDMALA